LPTIRGTVRLPLLKSSIKVVLFAHCIQPRYLSQNVEQRQPGSGPKGISFGDIHVNKYSRESVEISAQIGGL
jgi:hypothetical protein